MSGFAPAAQLSDLPSGRALVVEVEGVRVALCRLGDGVYAVEDLCTHDDGPLGEGAILMQEGQIECPRHGARFDIRTGAVCRMPAAVPVRVFPVRVENERVLVKVD
jgi:3-phenylpropionate/trans-cinnamate dioxygenase ferredoxin subunit